MTAEAAWALEVAKRAVARGVTRDVWLQAYDEARSKLEGSS